MKSKKSVSAKNTPSEVKIPFVNPSKVKPKNLFERAIGMYINTNMQYQTFHSILADVALNKMINPESRVYRYYLKVSDFYRGCHSMLVDLLVQRKLITIDNDKIAHLTKKGARVLRYLSAICDNDHCVGIG